MVPMKETPPNPLPCTHGLQARPQFQDARSPAMFVMSQLSCSNPTHI